MKPPLDAPVVPCRIAPDAWHPKSDESAQTKLAVHLCRTRCPITAACAEHGILHEKSGIYGGLTAEERRRIRRRRGIVVDTPELGIAYPRRGPDRKPGQEHGDEAGYKRHMRADEKPCRACYEGNLRARQDRSAKRRNAS